MINTKKQVLVIKLLLKCLESRAHSTIVVIKFHVAKGNIGTNSTSHLQHTETYTHTSIHSYIYIHYRTTME